MSKELGIQAKKENFSEWYPEVVKKAGLADYSSVSGCMVIRPYGYKIWENIQDFLNRKFEKMGVKNAYFPLFIPERLLKKETEHVEGFSPEVAWVTEAGSSKLDERLAIRPTSETIMYESYSKWIRSWRDLPLKINQWVNVVRWEFKHPILFLRTREFLWQEGHTVFATKEEAEEEVRQMLDCYAETYEKLLAVPVVKGRKTENEKFAGAEYTLSIETFLPMGKAIQCATSHHLGQNFSKQFEITFLDKNEEKKYAWQNSWGLSTRAIGIMIIMHGDDKGLILPPGVAPIQVVVVPIYYGDEDREKVVRKAREISEELNEFRVHVDERDEYTPGFKFNDWELKGVPLRIEIGPKDLEKNQVMLARRDTGEKISVKTEEVREEVERTLKLIQENLFERAKKTIEEHTKKANNYDELKKHLNGNWVIAPWCGKSECEEKIKEETGAKIPNIPFDLNKERPKGKCVYCGRDAKYLVYFAKSY